MGESKLSRPTMYTVQLGQGEHVVPAGGAEFSNHSCDPNLRVSFGDDGFENGDLVTLRPLKSGETLTWNYLTTEWDMSVPFDCQCGAANCLGQIAGFKYLAYEQRSEIQHLCSPFIMSRLNVEVPPFTMSGDGWYLADTQYGKSLTASRDMPPNTRYNQKELAP